MKYVKGNAVVVAEVMGDEVMVISTVNKVETESVICSIAEWNARLAMLNALNYKEVKTAEKKTAAPKTEKTAEDAPKTEKKKWIPYKEFIAQFTEEERRHFIEVRKAHYNEAKEYLKKKAAEAGKTVNLNDINRFANKWANLIIAQEKKAAEAAK